MEEPNKRQKVMAQETELQQALPPLPPKGSDVTALEYFKNKYFFQKEHHYNFLLEDEKRSKKLGTMTLQELFIEIWKKSLSAKQNKELHQVIWILERALGYVDEKKALYAFEQWAQENHIDDTNPPRVASVGYEIPGTKLSYQEDLDRFSQRVDELFHWWDQHRNHKYYGPYLCLVQSSGMGKTKLLYEYKMAQQANQAKLEKGSDETKNATSSKEERPTVFLILLSSLGFEMDRQKQIFDDQWDLASSITDIDPLSSDALLEASYRIFERLNSTVAGICEKDPSCKRIVLLFDESNCLLDKYFQLNAFLFRCVRVWLLEKKYQFKEHRIVAVFAGTNPRIASVPFVGDHHVRGPTSCSSRDHPLFVKHYHDRGSKFNPPFLLTSTLGSCLPLLKEADHASSEYARAVYYGRPLFATMAHAGILEGNISTALRRILLLDDKVVEWEQHRNTLINLLATRLQMGQTNMAVSCKLVSTGFAHLSGFSDLFDSYSCRLSYLPDPVCSRLAICMMDEDFHCELPATWTAPAVTIHGKDKRWWTEQMKEIFALGIVRPEHGNFGVVLGALYMLFCADVLRKKFHTNQEKGDSEDMTQHAYVHFSVALDEWLHTLQSGGTWLSPSGSPDTALKATTLEEGDDCKASVGFIQVCRNPSHCYNDSWIGLADQSLLKYAYEAGIAFYVSLDCPLIDMVIPLRIKSQNGSVSEFVPILVSIQCESSSLSLQDAETFCDRMKEQARKDNLDKAICLLIVLGSEPETLNLTVTGVSDDEGINVDRVISRVVFVPADDEFGVSDTWKTMTPTAHVEAESFALHSYFLMQSAEGASEAIRTASSRALADKCRGLWNAVSGTTL